MAKKDNLRYYEETKTPKEERKHKQKSSKRSKDYCEDSADKIRLKKRRRERSCTKDAESQTLDSYDSYESSDSCERYSMYDSDSCECCPDLRRRICKSESKYNDCDINDDYCPGEKDNKVIRYRTKSELDIENHMKSLMDKYGANYLAKKILLIGKKLEAENELKARKKEAYKCASKVSRDCIQESCISLERKSILKKNPSCENYPKSVNCFQYKIGKNCEKNQRRNR